MGGYQISLRLLQALIYPLSLPRRLQVEEHGYKPMHARVDISLNNTV